MGTSLSKRRKTLLGSAYRHFYDDPVHVVRGDGVYLYDADGTEYLDMYNNVPHVGHCHPRVVAAIAGQLGLLNTHTRYLHDGIVDYAERLLAYFPPSLDTAMFACTGSEANELALRIANSVTGGNGIVVVDYAYHGNSAATAAISPETVSKNLATAHVRTVPAPNTFSGEHRGKAAPEMYAEHVNKAIDDLRLKGVRFSAIVIDTIVSSAGVIEPPAGYLRRIADIAHQRGGLLIADEVQPGFARTGEHFWGFEADGITPDIVTMGKPMANGYPMSAVVASSDLMDQFAAQNGYFNTFGGSPVAAAAANCVLDVIEEEALMQNAQAMGQRLTNGLRSLQADHPAIGDVRGNGLFIGVEFVASIDDRAPSSNVACEVLNELRKERVLAGVVGPHDHILKLRPPMVFSNANADRFLECFERALVSQENNN